MKYGTGIETKNLILRVALKEFLDKGFHETSIRKIAKEAYITSGALYNHFSNKEDILRHIIDPHIDEWWDVCNYKISTFKNEIEKNASTPSSTDTYTFMELIERNIDIWRFVLFKSKNTKYESFIDELIEWEYINTKNILNMVYKDNEYSKYVSDIEIKYVIKSYINSCTNTFKLDIDKNERSRLLTLISQIYDPFWESLFSKKILEKEVAWAKKQNHQMKK